jgi:hypothetical protein
VSHGGHGGADPFASSPLQPGDPFSTRPETPWTPSTPPPPHPPRVPAPGSSEPETNTLATLSVIFAFVFAPAGAVLGHLGLTQIARTGQRGRDRALIGVTLSYVFIVVAVVAVAVWTITGGNPTAPTIVAKQPSSTTTTTTLPPTTATPAPPPPPLDGATLAGVLLPLDEVQTLTGDTGLSILQTADTLEFPPADSSVYQPADCIGSFLAGTPPPYQGSNYRQFYYTSPGNHDSLLQVVQGVARFDDAAAAQRALAGYVAAWTRCAGTKLDWLRMKLRQTVPLVLGAPQDAGDGVTTLVNHNAIDEYPFFRAIAAKNNVLVDVQVDGGDHVSGQAADVAKRILARIPG